MALLTLGNTMALYCWIAIGSALGGIARYWCSGVAARLFGETFPWGTLFVNVAGSFIIGFFATLTGPDGRIFAGSTTRQFVMLGLLGGFTTFSSSSAMRLGAGRHARQQKTRLAAGADLKLPPHRFYAVGVISAGRFRGTPSPFALLKRM